MIGVSVAALVAAGILYAVRSGGDSEVQGIARKTFDFVVPLEMPCVRFRYWNSDVSCLTALAIQVALRLHIGRVESVEYGNAERTVTQMTKTMRTYTLPRFRVASLLSLLDKGSGEE
jgi:hypothetical protein